MKNTRGILSALFSFGTMLALTACIDPVIIGNGGGGGSGAGGNNPTPCMTDAECPMGQACVNGACSNTNPQNCNGQPSPLSCTQTGCAAGQICTPDPDPSHCYPSACGCDATTGTWVCTADCGQGAYCAPAQPCGPNGGCPPGSMCDAAGMCTPVCAGTPEVCNGLDDDCDGAIDEQDDPAAPLCADGTACVMGQCGGPNLPCMSDADCGPNQLCFNGVCGGDPTCGTEICNGIDDDCNGLVDDGAGAFCADGTLCMGQCDGNPQQCGPNSPPCPPGQVCSAMGICVSGGCQPAPETCNGLDDDCDGKVDDATPGTTLCPNGGTCVNGQCSILPGSCGPMNPCPAGQVCSANGQCVPGVCQPAPEICNGLDDDCDGVIDDTAPGTSLCQGGICFAGKCTKSCNSNADCPAGVPCTNGLCL